MEKKRPVCISCNRKMSSWGRTSSGKKRYGCRYCKKTRVYKQTLEKRSKLIDLFKQYILWGHTYEQLASISGYSISYLEKEFHKFLRLEPPSLPRLDQSGFDETYLLIDGLWFGRWFVLMVYRQSRNLRLLHISVAGREVSTKIVKDLKTIKAFKYIFSGIVSDGGTGITNAIEKEYPHVPHQICMAHMHRRMITALGRYPRDQRVRELKFLADWIWNIESHEALVWWNSEVRLWLHRNIFFLTESHKDETGRSWFVHPGARKALRTLLRLHKTSFTFLDHPLMPKTTNEIEASFKHIGKRWQSHSGLKRERWEPFLKWFSYFYNKEKMSRNKPRED